jgi:hypothetical protein
MSAKAFEALGFKIARDGVVRRVMLSAEVWAAYEEIGNATDRFHVSQRRSLDRLFERFCDVAAHNNNEQQFVKEGNFGSDNETVWAFKAFQFRVYGASFKIDDKETFMAVKHDPTKKQNKANKVLLKASGNALSVVRTAIVGAKAEHKVGKKRWNILARTMMSLAMRLSRTP